MGSGGKKKKGEDCNFARRNKDKTERLIWLEVEALLPGSFGECESCLCKMQRWDGKLMNIQGVLAHAGLCLGYILDGNMGLHFHACTSKRQAGLCVRKLNKGWGNKRKRCM